jgi:peptidoglycan-N-acetylglucosamine deacetylase
MGFLCVSVDLDEIDCYHAIHGLSFPPEKDAARAVYTRALPRIARFFEETEIKGTFFAVGRDLDLPGNAQKISELFRTGNEIANHTQSHFYNFSLLSADEQAREIEAAGAAVFRATGVAPRGFRAPGYNINLGIVSLLARQGYSYDSSVFPCPSYYAAKAAAIGIKQLAGRTSKSVLGDPRVLGAPVTPYRMGEGGIWTRGENGLKELPITVVTKARLPFIGTSVAISGRLGAKMLAKSAAALPVVNLELHGMDFLDADTDDLTYLKAHQTDLRVPLKKRTAALEVAIKTLLDKGQEPVLLVQAARRAFV